MLVLYGTRCGDLGVTRPRGLQGSTLLQLLMFVVIFTVLQMLSCLSSFQAPEDFLPVGMLHGCSLVAIYFCIALFALRQHHSLEVSAVDKSNVSHVQSDLFGVIDQ